MRTRHWGTTIGGVALAATLAAATLAPKPAEARWRGCWGCGALAVGAIAGAAVSDAVLFLHFHPRPRTYTYPKGFPRFFSIAVHRHSSAFVPIRVFC